MNKQLSGLFGRRWKMLLGCLLTMGFLAACAATQQAGDKKASDGGGDLRVSAITASRDDSGEIVTLKSDDRLIFTSIKQPVPLGVVLYFTDTRIDVEPQGILPEFEVIEGIQVEASTESDNSTRVEIRLKKDVPYEVTKEEDGLRVRFSKSAQAASSPQMITAANLNGEAGKGPSNIQQETKSTGSGSQQLVRFKNITASPDSKVLIESDDVITSYSTFTLDSPPRIVVDVFNLLDRPKKKEKVIYGKSPWMKRIRYYGDDEKLRVVIDTQKQFLSKYQAIPTESGLSIQFEEAAPAESHEEKAAEAKEPAAPNPVEKIKPIQPNLKFTGEKIALDFFDTDIRNVFRILGEVSQKNFAVDKDVSGRVSLKLSDPVPWDQVLDLILKMNQLDKQVDENVIRIATLTTLKTEEALKREVQQEERKKKLSENLMTEYIQVNYADAEKEVFPHIARFFNKEQVEKEEGSRVSWMIQPDAPIPGTVSVDTRNNVIIITSVPEMIERAKDIVRRVDRVTPQVMIEARIVEASTTFSRDIGIDWSSAGGIDNDDTARAGIGPQRGFDRWQGTYGYDTAISLPITGPTFGFNFSKIIGSPFLLDAKLSAMESNDEGKIISSPRIMTLNNREAEIKQGVEVGYQTLDNEGNIKIEFKEVNLILKVTPQVTLDKRISLDIHVTKDDVISTFQTDVGDIPLISTKEATTKLLVNDGETIAIGGIAVSETGREEAGVPWLQKIPILGWLFQRTGTTNDKKELLIFMTPQIHQLEQRMPVTDEALPKTPKKS